MSIETLMHRTQKYVQYLGGGYPGNALTINKVYMVSDEDNEYYYLNNNWGRADRWSKDYFKVVE